MIPVPVCLEIVLNLTTSTAPINRFAVSRLVSGLTPASAWTPALALALGFGALTMTACTSSPQQKAEQRTHRTGQQVEQRTDNAIDRAVDRGLDNIFN